MKRARAIGLLFSLLLSFTIWQGASQTTLAQESAPATEEPKAAPVADPTGANTGGSGDVTAAEAGKPTIDEVAAVAGHNRISINFVWTLICGFLVMFMQAGFAMVETGFTRAKNAAHTMTMNFMVYALGLIGFWICGFALQMGGVGAVGALGGTPPLSHEFTIQLFGKTLGLFGTNGFFLSFGSYDVGVFGLFLFQMVFMDTAATIPTGSMAERWKFSSFVVFAFFMSMLVYPLYANWVWGGGWLATLGTNFGLGHGHVDFAGSSVVHLVGGVAAFVGAKVIGPRIGKFTKEGKPVAMPGHHLPMAIVGTFILAFGWFGFNAGSSLAGTDLRIAVVATNTMLAGATGAFSAMIYVWMRYGKPDPSMIANGMLAGLVAITAPCAFVNSISAAIIGAIAGVLVVFAVTFVENKLKIDDPVGAISVHGVCGAFGILSVGLFSDGLYGEGWNGVPGGVRGLFYGDAKQLLASVIGIVTCIIWVSITFYAFFKIQNAISSIRVSADVEIGGLDIPEMGALAYPEFQITSSSSSGDYSDMAISSATAPVLEPSSSTANS
jgi:Amt family ammonium transporter